MPSQSARALRWRAAVAEWWSGAWRWVLMAGGVFVAVRLLLDAKGANGVAMAVAISALVVGVVLTSSKPMAIALIATPALFVTQRLDIAAAGIAVSDVALAAGLGTAVLLGQRDYSRPLRQLLWANLLYQFATLFTVIVNPQAANTIEWFHAWLLVSGALIFGWALGRSGSARLALALMVIACLVIAAGTIFTGVFSYYLVGQFAPVYPTWPWEMHKNAAGTLMSFGLLILYVNPQWSRFPTGLARAGIMILAIAIIMTQSRQAMIGLIVAILLIVARSGRTGRSLWTFLLAIPGAVLIVATVIDQIESQNEFNSFFQRLDWMRELYAQWKLAPVFGHGLRYWYYNPSIPYQPPQAEFEVATSAGIVGLLAFAVMWVVVILVLWRIDPLYGTLAVAATLSRIVQAQFDLFWVAAQVSVPFAIAGICLGAMARGTPKSAGLDIGAVQSVPRTGGTSAASGVPSSSGRRPHTG